MKRLPLILSALVLVAFTFGLIHLLNLRFERGDIYPAYSSFRADPLGAKAFYESLGRLTPARRNLQPLSKLGEGRNMTLLWLGADGRNLRFQADEYRRFETFVRTGGRLVVGFMPVVQRPWASRFPVRTTRPGAPGTPPVPLTNAPPISAGPGLEEIHGIPIGQRWDFALDYADLSKSDGDSFLPAHGFLRATNESSALPRSLQIHTALFFDRLSPDWRVVYSAVTGTNARPVLVERRLGRGSIVLVADSYPFSNEAMLKDREPGLLTWFIGENQSVVFDETHLGVTSDPGIAALARKYRLHGFFAALLVLTALFLWKNATSFLPPHEEHIAGERDNIIVGKDSAAGFVNLLRRNIAPADLMKVCLEQWNAHSANTRKPPKAKLEAMQRIIDEQNALEPRQRDPVATYRRFHKILSKRL